MWEYSFFVRFLVRKFHFFGTGRIMTEISDLPWKDYNEYAKSVEQQRKELLKFKDEKQIIEPARIDVTTPSYPSPVRSLLQEDLCNATWSDIPVLDENIRKKSTCFSSDLIPRVGSQEKLMALKEKLDKLAGGK